VQSASPLAIKTLSLLDAHLFSARPDVQFRVYGHYTDECDLRLVTWVPHVRDFAADSLTRAHHVDAIGELPQLRRLSLGIYENDSFDVLGAVSPALESLSLGATRSKKPDLAVLARFASLRQIYIEGHTKNIDVLAELTMLEDVTLRSTTTQDLGLLAPLKRMWSLDIKLGGTTNLEAIRGMPGIKYLELWQIRGLQDVSVISDLPGLQNVFLQALPLVRSLPSLDSLHHLRRLVVESMKGLRDLSVLETAPALEEFAYIDALGKDPTLLLPALRNPNVRRVSAGFGSQRKNDQFEELRDKYAKAPMSSLGRFEYR